MNDLEKKIARMEFENMVLTDELLITSLYRGNFVRLCNEMMEWYDEIDRPMFLVVNNGNDGIKKIFLKTQAEIEYERHGVFLISLVISLDKKY